MKKYCFILLCLMVGVACMRPDYTKQKAEVKNLIQTVDSLESVLQDQTLRGQNDSALKIIQADLKFFEDKFTVDNRAVYRDEVAWISNYRSIRKLVKDQAKNLGYVQKEISVSKKQLTDLLTDLEAGIGEPAKMDSFIVREKHFVDQLDQSLVAIGSNEKRFWENYQWMKPKIDSIKTTFKNR